MWYNDSNIDKRDCIPATTQLKIHPRATKRAGSPREEWHQYDMHVIANARAQGIIELSNHTTWSRSEKMTTSSIPGMLVGPGNRVYSSPVLLHHSNKSDFFAQKPLNLTGKVNTIDQEYSLMHIKRTRQTPAEQSRRVNDEGYSPPTQPNELRQHKDVPLKQHQYGAKGVYTPLIWHRLPKSNQALSKQHWCRYQNIWLTVTPPPTDKWYLRTTIRIALEYWPS